MSKVDIDRLCYELYKQDWMSRIPMEDRLESLRDWAEEGEDESYSEWLEDQGYGGSLYACYEEFLDAEFQDQEYMHELLNRSSLKDTYDEYMQEYGRE